MGPLLDEFDAESIADRFVSSRRNSGYPDTHIKAAVRERLDPYLPDEFIGK